MTIDEAIEHAEEVMVENLEKTKGRNASDPIALNCFKCAEEHRQVAEWLKELKQYKKQTGGDLISRQAVIDIVKFECGEWVGLAKTITNAIEQMPSAEKTANKININEYVKVRLTDYGKEIFYHQYDDLNKFYGKEMIKPSYPTVDSDGYTSFQLWYFINLYGRYIDMGVQNVIEPLEIVFESAEKTAEWRIVGKTTLHYECSACGGAGDKWDKFCKNCGAFMRVEE